MEDINESLEVERSDARSVCAKISLGGCNYCLLQEGIGRGQGWSHEAKIDGAMKVLKVCDRSDFLVMSDFLL